MDGPLSKTDGYLKIDLEPRGAGAVTVFATETISSFHPTWKAQRIALRSLCWADIDMPIKISVWDANMYVADDYIGEIRFTAAGDRLTVRHLMDSSAAYRGGPNAPHLVVSIAKKKLIPSPTKAKHLKKGDVAPEVVGIGVPTFPIIDPHQARFAESTNYTNSGILQVVQFEFVPNDAASTNSARSRRHAIGDHNHALGERARRLEMPRRVLDSAALVAAIARAAELEAPGQHGYLTVKVHGIRGLLKHTGFNKVTMSNGILHPRTEAEVCTEFIYRYIL